MNKQLSIVIPCYNESKNLEKLIINISNAIKNVKHNIEVIIVNNGSTDDSRMQLETLTSNIEYIKILNIKKNVGYGRGILEGLKITEGKFMGWTHADLQCDFIDCINGFDLIFEEYKKNKKIMVKGKRKNRNFIDNLFTFFMSIFVMVFFRKKIFDINAQPKIFERSLYDKFNNPPEDFLLDFYILNLAKNLRYKIFSIDVFFFKRKGGVSKGGGSVLGKLKLSLKTIYYIIKNTYGNNNSSSK